MAAKEQERQGGVCVCVCVGGGGGLVKLGLVSMQKKVKIGL